MRFPFKFLFLAVCAAMISAPARSASEFRGLYLIFGDSNTTLHEVYSGEIL